MTQLASVVAITRVMRGGRHRCIRSHCIAFDCTPGPPILLLPRSIEAVTSYRVDMVTQSNKVRKMHRIRNQKVRDVFKFYRDNNPMYQNVTPNDPVLNTEYEYSSIEKQFVEHIDDTTGELDAAMNAEQENIRGGNDTFSAESENEESNLIERRIGLADTSTRVMAREHPATSRWGERQFEVRRSDKISSDSSVDLFARIFPHLFPFGRGHPGEYRDVSVSFHECIKYYTLLSGRQFAEDELFSLVAFDRVSLKKMYAANHFRCQRFPRMLDEYETLTGEELGRAILENERRRQGCLPWRSNVDYVAQKVLKTVELGSRSLWGSNAERSQCRYTAFAYQTRFGQPALFVTLTPNTDNSLVLGHYAGVSSVESLFDILESRLPQQAELKEASLRNDCASTRIFMRQVDAFIKYVLGIDPKTKKRLSFRGLLGDVKAYFGMVETQGRGTLHIYLLIWLNNCPPNSSAIERVFQSPKGSHFRDQVLSYAQSIVTNDLPIPVESCGCSNCGAPFSALVGVPVPESARKDPLARNRDDRAHKMVREPALIRCDSCDYQCSSQHLLRCALLRFRPKQWPLWNKCLSRDEVTKQAAIEYVCRNTMTEALKVINERETSIASLKGDSEVGVFSAEKLHRQNCAQMTLRRSDQDVFKNDKLTHFFEISPPAVADDRIVKSHMDYIVSALAVKFNQHLWNHTSSCFKQSRSTAHDSYCRYRFLREVVSRALFDSSGVQLKRKLGHEYINAFNYDIMATFRCNHDIQVLLGGSDITDRIFYCCKYVTKYQKRLDSQVAVAVAALKRRQEREQIAASISGPQDRRIVARKRVAALIYNLTNRQEIVGPLAALYLYHGSCCYSSASCTSLPLGDVIRQLTTTEEYNCALVVDDDSQDSPKFHAVSNLDDYIYRPDELKNVNLYEFTMWYFRKKEDNPKSIKLKFLNDHPLHASHCLGKRYIDVVPVIQGFRMPSIKNDSSKAAYKRAVLSLVLFKPFRVLQDLIGMSVDCGDEEAWLQALESWVGTRSKFVQTIMENMQDFYIGQQKAKDQRVVFERTPENRAATFNETIIDDNDDIYSDDGIDAYDDIHDDVGIDESMVSLWETAEGNGIVLESSSLNPAACPTSPVPDNKTAAILGVFEKYGLLDQAAEDLTSAMPGLRTWADLPPVNIMKKWIRDSTTDNGFASQVGASTASLAIQNSSRDTQVIELLNECLLETNMAWRPSPSPEQAVHLPKSFASISDISTAYTLNERQHYAFKAIGQALQRRWIQAETDFCSGSDLESKLRNGQLLLFLGGAGGTGKSRVIDSVQAFVESWRRPRCLIKTALTGKAATLISGRTLSSFLLQIRNPRAGEAIADLELLIIDEVSMMKKYQLAQLDKRLRAAKRVPGVVFGGVHDVLAGDFLQLPPVGGSPLYQDPSQKCNKGKILADELAGYELWKLFVDVIMLKISVRFKRDPEWGRGCEQARLGVWTSEFVEIVNSRVIERERKDTFIASKTTSTFVTPENTTRVGINRLFVSTAAKRLSDGEYPVRVIANFRGKLRGLNRSEVTLIMGLPDTKFGRMAPYLDLIVGMPIQVSQNIRAEKMIANGTLGTLEAIIYHPGTTFCLVYDSIGGVTVKVPCRPPPVVLVRINRGAMATGMSEGFDPNIFPLFFDSQAYSSCDITLPGTVNGVPRLLPLKLQQFPLVCAVASTIYKVQGETLESMIVTEWRSKSAIANKKEQPYLLVSRVTTREAFTALEPLTSDIIAWAHPPQAALDEETRLDRLSDLMIAKLAPITSA